MERIMIEKINRIDIIPAIFLKYREDGNALIKCLQGNETINRAFEPHMIKKISNPKHILIGVMSGDNMMKITITDGNEYKELFNKKWNVLLK